MCPMYCSFAFLTCTLVLRSHVANGSVSLPFTRILCKEWDMLNKADEPSIPGNLLSIIGQSLRGLLVLKTHDRNELVVVVNIPEQFSRKVAFCSGLLVALPGLVQGNNRVFFARPRLVGGHGHEHIRSPVLCQ